MAQFATPFLFAGDHEAGERAAQYFLYSAAKRLWERARLFKEETER